MLAIFDQGRDESRSRRYGARSAQSYQSRTWESGLTPSSVSSLPLPPSKANMGCSLRGTLCAKGLWLDCRHQQIHAKEKAAPAEA